MTKPDYLKVLNRRVIKHKPLAEDQDKEMDKILKKTEEFYKEKGLI